MKKDKYFLFLLILLSITALKAQNKEAFYIFETAVTNDFNTNISGGVKQGFSFLGNIDLILSFDTEKAKLWKGGQFFFYGLANYGDPLSEFVGDIQTTNNIEAENNVRLYQFWYKQSFNNFEIIIGQHDLNSEFASTDNGSLFINSSFGIQPDISINNAISIFPVATLGVVTKLEVSNFSFLAAVYNGNPGSEEANPNSLNWFFSKENGVMSIFEIQYTEKREGTTKGTLKLGFWNHGADIVVSREGQYDRYYDNNQGIYCIADYTLFTEKNDPNQGLGAFIQIGITPQKSNLIKNYLGFGANYQGLIPKRDKDHIGLAFGSASFISDLKNESIIEFSYLTYLNSNFSFQPDIQYIINPSGNDVTKDALVVSLRTKLEF